MTMIKSFVCLLRRGIYRASAMEVACKIPDADRTKNINKLRYTGKNASVHRRDESHSANKTKTSEID
jgi:hypothetical protein